MRVSQEVRSDGLLDARYPEALLHDNAGLLGYLACHSEATLAHLRAHPSLFLADLAPNGRP